MKKLFTLVAMAMMVLGVSAQKKIAEVDFTTATEFTGWNQFGDGQEGSVELMEGIGLAITVGSQTGELWQPQTMVIGDGSFNLAEDGNYKVVITAQFPSNGTLQINMGSWGSNAQQTFEIEATGDFQTVECQFDPWGMDVEGCHLLFQNGDFAGVTIIQKIELWDLDASEGEDPGVDPGAGSADGVLAEVDFTAIDSFTGWNQFGDGQEGSVELIPGVGLSITVGTQTGELWQPQTMVIGDGSFNLAEDGNYKVVITAKYPTNGTLQINMGSWGSNAQQTFDVISTGDFQTDEFVFDPWGMDVEGCHLLFQNGDFLGTTIIQSIKLIDLDAVGGDPTGIKTLKNKAENGVRFNLSGQQVDANYKGVVIMNGKKFMQK
jgi:hypothetical protein